MPQKQSKKIAIIFDTNTSGGNTGILPNIFKKLRKLEVDYPDYKLELILPNIVVEEHIRHLNKRTRSEIKAAKDASDFLKKHFKTRALGIPNAKDLSAEKFFKEQLDNYSIKTIPLNNKEVSINKLVNAALDNTPPFNPGIDKGVKDYLILESIKQNKDLLSKYSEIYFICNDSYFKKAIEVGSKWLQKINVLSSHDSLYKELIYRMKVDGGKILEEAKTTVLKGYRDKILQEIKSKCATELEMPLFTERPNRIHIFTPKKKSMTRVSDWSIRELSSEISEESVQNLKEGKLKLVARALLEAQYIYNEDENNGFSNHMGNSLFASTYASNSYYEEKIFFVDIKFKISEKGEIENTEIGDTRYMSK